jgi:hypothetical protein
MPLTEFIPTACKWVSYCVMTSATRARTMSWSQTLASSVSLLQAHNEMWISRSEVWTQYASFYRQPSVYIYNTEVTLSKICSIWVNGSDYVTAIKWWAMLTSLVSGRGQHKHYVLVGRCGRGFMFSCSEYTTWQMRITLTVELFFALYPD